MNNYSKVLTKQVKYDLIIFFREPFFALPILLLPGCFLSYMQECMPETVWM